MSNTDSRGIPKSTQNRNSNSPCAQTNCTNICTTTRQRVFLLTLYWGRNNSFELERIFVKDGLVVQTNFYYFQSIKRWNALPREVVESPFIVILKKRLVVKQKISFRSVNKNDSNRKLYCIDQR